MDVAEVAEERCGRNSGWGLAMQPRHIGRATSFEPDALMSVFKAFDDAWSEIAPRISAAPVVVEAARMALAMIVLRLAKANAISADGLAGMAVAVFCAKYRIEVDEPAADRQLPSTASGSASPTSVGMLPSRVSSSSCTR